MSTQESAFQSFNNGFNCAQAVITAYGGKYNLDDNTAKKLSCGFGGGCGRQSLTCGAVSGAYMVIGLKYGQTEKDNIDARNITYKMVNEFSAKFKTIHNSINCKELLGVDLATPEGQEFVRNNNLSKIKCTKYVTDACIILDEMGL
jgi:C_GCAxxG_C_C family probable redox protein